MKILRLEIYGWETDLDKTKTDLRVCNVQAASPLGFYRWETDLKSPSRCWVTPGFNLHLFVICNQESPKLQLRFRGSTQVSKMEGIDDHKVGFQVELHTIRSEGTQNFQMVTGREGIDENLVRVVKQSTIRLLCKFTLAGSRLAPTLVPGLREDKSPPLLASIDEPSSKRKRLNSHVSDQWRYICQPGDHSGDNWHIAAALLLDSRLKVVTTTRTPKNKAAFLVWRALAIQSCSYPRELESLEFLELEASVLSARGHYSLKVAGQWVPYETPFRLKVNAVCVFSKETTSWKEVVHVSTDGSVIAKGVLPDYSKYVRERLHLAGEINVHTLEDGDVLAVQLRSTLHQVQGFNAKEPSLPLPCQDQGFEIHLVMQVSEMKLAATGTKAKFYNKLNQFCRFYLDLGILPERILINRGVKSGQNWSESFNLGAATARDDSCGNPLYGMTWCSTSVILHAVEREGLQKVQETLRRAFVRGLSEVDRTRIRAKLKGLDSGKKYLFVNMRYATHNKEHNITPAIYKTIRDEARRRGMILVRVGLPDKSSQDKGCKWMQKLVDDPAIDIYEVENRPDDAPVEVDPRQTACFWSCVVEMKNVFGVIGGRSGSLDAAAFMGVRAFCWDIIDRPEEVEKTEYARLWIAFPFMSIGSRSKDPQGGLDIEALQLWLTGHHVIPRKEPPRGLLHNVLRASQVNKALKPPSRLRLLLRPLGYLTTMQETGS